MASSPAKTPYSRIDSITAAPSANTRSATELRLLPDKGNSENKPNTYHPHFASSPLPSPWLGAAALLSIVFLTAAAIGVLLASRGSSIEQWKVDNVRIQPQVWLSVLATIMDGLTVFALAKAAEIMYWRAVARGTTLRKMYDLYESYSLWGAINNLLHLRCNYLAFVSILCLVSTLRGPLFQRASVVANNVTRKTSATLELHVAQLIPPNFLYPNGTQTSLLYDAVYDAYIERAPININISDKGCGDFCNGKVKGYGFDIKCSNLTTLPWDESENSTVRERFQDPGNAIGGDVPSFNSSAHLQGVGFDEETGQTDPKEFLAAEQRGWFDVVNLFKSEPLCGGDLSISTCALHHAVVEYDVSIRKGVISLSQDSWLHDKVLFQTPTWLPAKFVNEILDVELGWGPTTHWVSWYLSQFNQEISLYPNGDGGAFIGLDNRYLLAKRFVNGSFIHMNCNTTFGDPTQFVLNRLREMAFRTAVAAANFTNLDVLFGDHSLAQEAFPLTRNWTQEVAVTGEETIVAFSVSIPYLVCAIACSLSAVMAMVPLYWKAKKERMPSISFNPLHVARIFEAPLLRDVHEESIERYVRKQEGRRRVKVRLGQSDDDKKETASETTSDQRDA